MNCWFRFSRIARAHWRPIFRVPSRRLSAALQERSRPDKAAATALADVPYPEAQRSLADLVLDPSRAMPIRKQSAAELCTVFRALGR